jgi:DNA-binding PadR family transcriptional regulator
MPRKRVPPDLETFLPLAPADLQLLMVLVEQPLHAYGISRAVETRETGVSLEIGSLYRMLTRMEGQGLIQEREGDDRATGPESRRRYYGITRLGRQVAAAEAERLRAVVSVAESKNLIRARR